MLTTTTTNSIPAQPNGAPQRLTTRDLEESTGTLPVLGYSTQWNLSQIEISHTDLIKALQDRGFLDTTPDKPSPTVALRRAMTRWVHNRTLAAAADGTDLTPEFWSGELDSLDSFDEAEEEGGPGSRKSKARAKKSLLRKINSPQSEWLVFGLVIEQLDLAALGLSYATRLRVFLHKKTLAIHVSSSETGFDPTSLTVNEQGGEEKEGFAGEPEIADITAEIRQLFHYYREHQQARDVSMLLKQLVGTLDSFSLRRLGGVYFVPQQHQPELESLRKLVEDLPAAAGQTSDKFMLKLPILDGAGAKKQLAQAAHRDFLLELSAMEADLDRLTEEAAHRQLRPDTVARRLATYRELKAKAEVYADLLDMQQGRILTAVEKLTGQASQLLESITDYALQHSDHQQTFNWDNLTAQTGEAEAAQPAQVEVEAATIPA